MEVRSSHTTTSGETVPLLAGKLTTHAAYVAECIEVEPLHYSEIPRGIREAQGAFAGTSLEKYFRDAQPTTVYDFYKKAMHALNFADAIHAQQRKAITVDHGNATCTYGLPGSKPNPLLSWISPLIKAMQSAELIKRQKEFTDAVRDMLGSAPFGEKIQDMIEIQTLATSTKKQGRGYGTALVKVVTDLADEQSRASYLITTDAYGFYETLGYRIIREAWIGGDNPKWDGPPVPIRVMLRESQSIRRDIEKGGIEKASLPYYVEV